jgi:hypothetical protein
MIRNDEGKLVLEMDDTLRRGDIVHVFGLGTVIINCSAGKTVKWYAGVEPGFDYAERQDVIPPTEHEQEFIDLFAKYQQLAQAAIQDSAKFDEQRAAWMREREELVRLAQRVVGISWSAGSLAFDDAIANLRAAVPMKRMSNETHR